MRSPNQNFICAMAADRIRTTISLDPEVHAIFIAMAEASGLSVSRCMGDWLADTAEGAQFVAMKMREARNAPKTVMREMQAAVHGLAESLDQQAEEMRGRARQERAARLSGVAPLPRPPSSPTGVKSPSGVTGKAKKPGSRA